MPPPTPEPLANNSTRRTCRDFSANILECPNGDGILLSDGVFGPVGTYSSSTIHAWNRSAQTVRITYQFMENLLLRHVSVSFYTVPSVRGGLPNIEVFHRFETTGLSYTIANNEALNENGRNEVILSIPTTPATTSSYSIEFDFEGTDIDWLFLSEVTFCSSPANDSKFVMKVLRFQHFVFES